MLNESNSLNSYEVEQILKLCPGIEASSQYQKDEPAPTDPIDWGETESETIALQTRIIQDLLESIRTSGQVEKVQETFSAELIRDVTTIFEWDGQDAEIALNSMTHISIFIRELCEIAIRKVCALNEEVQDLDQAQYKAKILQERIDNTRKQLELLTRRHYQFGKSLLKSLDEIKFWIDT
ncbi:hypothetical protein [Roseofilum sp. Belize Diploria]|uniref:hypothetical protein n=1 Tax=Roseofilum sp. Belize Diploria TaxID=2821501 RepID=UPI001B1E1294|nr:hypothetical protein [Roseofilum sp. Belize Diploria]MBP0011297.1 hypothetical protein [Roseofilum sp. Belize Diploria]